VSALPHFKGLDGVRGIAVLMVLAIHSRMLPFGWIGVPIFFVLSGFLITGILLTQTNRPIRSFLAQFYWRRGLRILPVYYLYMAICAICYVAVRGPATWPAERAWLLTFTYNIARVSPHLPDSDYFGHLWTLCVEEQFYLVWPFVVYFLPLKQFRRLVVLLVLAGPLVRYASGSILAAHLGETGDVARAVRCLPTSHLDAFAFGALLAVAPAEWLRRLKASAGPLFFVVVALTFGAGFAHAYLLRAHGLPPHWLALGYDSLEYFHQYAWAYSLLNLFGAALVLCAISDTLISRLLSYRPLAYVGAISYGLYLWHLPLLCVFSTIWPAQFHSASGLARFAVYFAAALGVAALSYHGFERHFLRMKDMRPGKALKAFALRWLPASVGSPGDAQPPPTAGTL